jgi:Glycosyl hydrolase 108
MSYFDQCFELVVGIEGGYTNDPNDPGGETKFGISKRSYPDVDIASLTLEGAKDLYLRDFWGKLHLDKIPWPLCLYAFDCGVNQGVNLCWALLSASHDEAEFMTQRALSYARDRDLPRYGHSWFHRMFQLIIYVRSLPRVSTGTVNSSVVNTTT